jgi:hypothetical protein
VAHLVLVEFLLSTSLTRALDGDSSPLPESGGTVEGWRAYRTAEIARLSAQPIDQLLAAYRAGLKPVAEAQAKLLAARDGSRPGWHPAGLRPATWFPGQWLVEIALHDWDLRVALDREARVNPAAAAALGPEMRSRMPSCVNREKAVGLDGSVRIALADSTSWLARITAGRLETADDGQPDATIETDAGSYALAQTARRPASFFAERGRWQTQGDRALVDGLAAAFVGY